MARHTWTVSSARRIVAGAIAVALLASCSGGGGASTGADTPSTDTGSGGSDRPRSDSSSVEDEPIEFCRVLADGIGDLSQATRSAGDSTADQFLLFVSNVSRANTLFAELESAAPKEIATEMTIAADAWDDQMDAAGKFASDPMGALGAVFLTAMLSTDAVAKVDRWSELNCGQAVFGAGVTMAGSQPCAWLPAPSFNAAFPAALDASEPYSQLADALSLVVANVPGGGSDAAAELLAATGALVPAPLYTVEALGRLAWTDVAALDLVTQVDSSVRSLCQLDAFRSDDTARLAQLGPVVTGERKAAWISSLFGRCAVEAVIIDFSLLYRCNESLEYLDLATGVVTRLDGLGTETNFPQVNKDRFLRVSPSGLFWIVSVEEPASGLNPPRYVTLLRSLDFATRTPNEVEIYSTDERFDDTTVDFVGSSSDRAVVRLAASFEVFDMGLNHVASIPIADPTWGEPQWLTEHTFVMPQDDGTQMIDIAAGTAEIVPGADGFVRGRVTASSVCADRGFIEVGTVNGGADTLLTVLDDDAGVRWGPALDAESVELLPESLVAPDRFVRTGNRGTMGVDPSGAVIWQIADNVVSRAFVFGGWVVVQNHSDEIFVLDPMTGQETSVSSAGLMDAIRSRIEENAAGNSELRRYSVDWNSGWASYRTYDEFWQTPAEVLCPRDYSLPI